MGASSLLKCAFSAAAMAAALLAPAAASAQANYPAKAIELMVAFAPGGGVDLFGRTVASPRHVYLLAVRKESPDFRLVAVPDSAPVKKQPADVVTSASSMWRGEALPIKLLVLRRDGFKEDITVTASGLPAGITAPPLRIPAASNVISFFLAAKDDAPAGLGEVKLTGTAKLGEATLVREARLSTVSWDLATDNNTTEGPQTRLARSFPLAVTDRESAPLTFAMDAKQPLETCVFNKLLIPVNFTRRADFKADVKLKVTGNKDLEKIPELAGSENTKSIQLVLNLAEQKLSPGEHTFWLQTRAKGKMRPYMDASKAAEEASKAADKEAADAAKVAKEAKEAAAKVAAPAGPAPDLSHVLRNKRAFLPLPGERNTGM